MEIKKGQKLFVSHYRKGCFNCVASQDFDSSDIWWTVTITEFVEGLVNVWEKGETISLRKDLIRGFKILS